MERNCFTSFRQDSWLYTLIKKEIKFSSYIWKFRMEQLQSLIWLTASSYMVKYLRISSYILGSPSSYMTLQLIHSEFPNIRGKFDFLFYQCSMVQESCLKWLDWTQVEAGLWSGQDLCLGRALRLYRSLVWTGFLPLQDSCLVGILTCTLIKNPCLFRTLAWKRFLSRQYSGLCLDKILIRTCLLTGRVFCEKRILQDKTLFWTTFFWTVCLSWVRICTFLERILVWPRTLSIQCSCLGRTSV